jgi:hypothetical protein
MSNNQTIEQEQTFLMSSVPNNISNWKLEYTKDVYIPQMLVIHSLD